MQNNYRYVPILKLKSGEVKALKQLERNPHDFTPFFEIPPIPWDYQEDHPAKNICEHLSKTPSNLEKCCGEDPFFIDFKYIEDETSQNTSLEQCFGEIRAKGLNPTPVIYLNTSPAYESKILGLAFETKSLCIRLQDEDFDNENYSEEILQLVNEVQLHPNQIDIMLDLGSIPTNGLTPFLVGLKNIIRFFPKIQEWKTVTLASTAFPESLQ